jgi:transposase
VVLERKLTTTPKAMKEVLGGMPRSRIALETGMHSPWVSRLLSELGHEMIVAHARNRGAGLVVVLPRHDARCYGLRSDP